MCENDAAVDAWMRALNTRSKTAMGSSDAVVQMGWRAGQMAGVIRELAATVPGVREWLLEHMP